MLEPKAIRRLIAGGAPDIGHPVVGQEPCRLEVGQVVVIEKHRLWITITRVTAKAGRWRVEYRISDHRPRLLGKKVGYADHAARALRATYVDQEDIRRDELEAVEEGWIDRGIAGRKARHEDERRKAMTVEQKLRDVDQLAARLKQVLKETGRKGRDLTPALEDIYARLAREEQQNRKAA
jgi:hypothetical protein